MQRPLSDCRKILLRFAPPAYSFFCVLCWWRWACLCTTGFSNPFSHCIFLAATCGCRCFCGDYLRCWILCGLRNQSRMSRTVVCVDCSLSRTTWFFVRFIRGDSTIEKIDFTWTCTIESCCPSCVRTKTLLWYWRSRNHSTICCRLMPDNARGCDINSIPQTSRSDVK